MPKLFRLLFLLVAPAAFAQTPQTGTAAPALHYDTVSIHEALPDAQGHITWGGPTGGNHAARLTLNNWPLFMIVSSAFNLPTYRIAGFPDEFQGRYWQVNAQAGDEADAALKSMTNQEANEAKQRMLQEILTDRFHLRYHFETRDEPNFALTAGKQTKLHASAAMPLVKGDGRSYDREDPTQPAIHETADPGGIILSARGQSMAQLAQLLAGTGLKGPVVDRTGINGLWDFTLRWSNHAAAATSGDVETFPPLDAALVDQLGLKLERSKSPQPFLIIEHIEPPTPN